MAEELNVGSAIDGQQQTQKNKYITFAIDKEDFAIPIFYIKDIISYQIITQLPSVPNYIKGITNLRGTVIPIVDVRARFMKPEAEYNDRTCFVVIEYEDLSIGLVVDNVKEVLQIPEENILQPPKAKMGYHNRYVQYVGKVGDSVKLILDLEKLIKEDYEL